MYKIKMININHNKKKYCGYTLEWYNKDGSKPSEPLYFSEDGQLPFIQPKDYWNIALDTMSLLIRASTQTNYITFKDNYQEIMDREKAKNKAFQERLKNLRNTI